MLKLDGPARLSELTVGEASLMCSSFLSDDEIFDLVLERLVRLPTVKAVHHFSILVL